MSDSELLGTRFCEVSYLIAIITLPVVALYHLYQYLFVFSLVCVFYKILQKRKKKTLDIAKKAVLITGCDTGFGYHLAKRLDDNGFIVYAGVLKPNGDGACALKSRKSKNLKVLKLDVTSDDDVKDAVAFVHKNKTGLWGIVNNAGFNIYGDVEICFIDHYKQVLDCDLYGQIRIIKSFLPLIRKSKGRIVNISSVMGLYACPGDSIYHTAKAGVEAFTQCLRYEMIKFGVRVSVVEPGWYDKATSCSSPEQLQRIRSNLNEMWQAATDEVRVSYGKDYVDKLYNIIADSGTGDAATSPEPVLAAIEDALINVNSQYRYLVGGSSRWIDPAAMLARIHNVLPDCIMYPVMVWFNDCKVFPTEKIQ